MVNVEHKDMTRFRTSRSIRYVRLSPPDNHTQVVVFCTGNMHIVCDGHVFDCTVYRFVIMLMGSCLLIFNWVILLHWVLPLSQLDRLGHVSDGHSCTVILHGFPCWSALVRFSLFVCSDGCVILLRLSCSAAIV